MSSDLPANGPDPSTDPSGAPTGIYRLAWGFYLVLAVAAVVWIGSSHGSIPLALFVDPASWWIDAILGVLAGLALVALWDVGRHLLPAMRRLEEALAEQIGPLDPAEALALALISGFAEELFFRGAVQSSWGFLWATAIFTAMHWGRARVFRWWTLFAFVAALVFGGLTAYRGNISAAVISHTLVNGINLYRLSVRHLAGDGSVAKAPSPEPERDLLDSADAGQAPPRSGDRDPAAKERE